MIDVLNNTAHLVFGLAYICIKTAFYFSAFIGAIYIWREVRK